MPSRSVETVSGNRERARRRNVRGDGALLGSTLIEERALELGGREGDEDLHAFAEKILRLESASRDRVRAAVVARER